MVFPVATCSHVISMAMMQRARASLYKQGASGRLHTQGALDMLCKQAPPECRLAAILQVVCCSCCSSRLSSCLLICFTCAFYSRTGLATLTCALITNAEQAPLTSWTRAAAVVCSATSLACSSRSLLVTC